MNTIRILLADDHRVLRDGLRSLIEAQPDLKVVGETGDGREVLREADALRPDVVVMDFTMPGMSGVEATEKLKATHPEVKVLALTVHEDRGYFRRFIEAGASGYALKQTPAEELFHAIRVVASGGVYLDPALAGKVLGGIVRKATLNSLVRNDRLSDREVEVLRLIARGFSNKEIAAQLAINAKTVETYKARSQEKLGLRGRADIVRYALQMGWLKGE